MAVLWMTRSNLNIGSLHFHGWSNIFSHPEYFNDGTVAIFMASLLYFIPSRTTGTSFIMNWEVSKKLPWGIVLLFGGGFALALGFKDSGLSQWFGESLKIFKDIHPLVLVFMVSFLMVMLTELTSNTATTQILLPILAALAVSLKINPLLLMIPATISASMAFMLPVATPPNAIVFSSNKITVPQMARAGLIMNLVTAIVITLFAYYYAPLIFNFDISSFPAWAH